MNWEKKKLEMAEFWESQDGRWRISETLAIANVAVFTLWDRSGGYSKFIGNFKTLEQAMEQAK